MKLLASHGHGGSHSDLRVAGPEAALDHLCMLLRRQIWLSTARRSAPLSCAHWHRGFKTGTAAADRRLTAASAATLVRESDAFLFDCDGVIWRGDELIPGIANALEQLRARGKRLIFVTNNSTKSRQGYLQKFHSLGIESVTAPEILSSSFAAAAYLAEKHSKAYVVGEVGIGEELDLVGVAHLGGPEDAGKVADTGPGGTVSVDPDISAVVVGFDRHFNYYKLQYATQCILGGAEFIATNCDALAHITSAQRWAAAGSMVGAVRAATRQQPTVVGKPSQFMLEHVCKEFGIKRRQICMVGDRLDTDIAFGKTGGTRTLLVLSGVTSEQQLRETAEAELPDLVAASVPELLSAIAGSPASL
eukprot:SAG11_NODE_357_length_10240_cov_4.621142_7_plen_361_part_00